MVEVESEQELAPPPERHRQSTSHHRLASKSRCRQQEPSPLPEHRAGAKPIAVAEQGREREERGSAWWRREGVEPWRHCLDKD